MTESIAAQTRTPRDSHIVELAEIQPASMSADARTILDHDRHMTTVQQERFPDGISLDVLHANIDGGLYTREVMLRRKSDGIPVLYAVLDVSCDLLPAPLVDQLKAAEQPFGQILIDSGIERRIEVQRFVTAATLPAFAGLTGDDRETVVGREIIIYCDDQPAINVLELLVNEP